MKYTFIIMMFIISSLSFGQPGKPDINNVKMMKKWKMVEYLELTEDQSIKFFPRIEKFENTIEDIRIERRRLYEDIEVDIERGNEIELSELESLLSKYRELEEKELQLKHDHISNLTDILTPTQIARYSIFEHKFRVQMRENIEKRKRDFPQQPRRKH